MTAASAAPGRSHPKQGRAQQTYELLLDVAGALLAEVGVDRISTNMICARAGVTPPALYRYFEDKYAVLEALGRRLMARQNVALEDWIARHADQGLDALRDGIEELLRETARVTQSEPGAVWILRALHASPRLIHVRLESHRYVTDKLVEAYTRYLPDMDRDELWQRLRLSVELGFAADEMLQEETRVSEGTVLKSVARLLRNDL
ncbi:TetR/AcrR family transcriptional regulator [Sphingomonas sp. QA11]|uniref:TetR/AcrR family transcriptional regulator n=1 Tax=Sphingomonas sp. QA11 TaxID=2950605 RepID=UPI0023491B2E|nr:TetR/AcrR family transcriptional regulator [Sphingomonas sp. QA11]WCM25671.1 TetR/AcrR family transcriptional regulator [Sphingomonas sp. QA11]